MADTRACRLIFGADTGDQIHEMVERRLGRTCPCLAGRVCPLLDRTGWSSLLDEVADTGSLLGQPEVPAPRKSDAGCAAPSPQKWRPAALLGEL